MTSDHRAYAGAMPYANRPHHPRCRFARRRDPHWIIGYADPALRERMQPLYVATVAPGEEALIDDVRKHADPEYRALDEEQIMLRKNWRRPTGAFIADDRPLVDLLGFASQSRVQHVRQQGAAAGRASRRPRIRLRPGACPQPGRRR